MLSNVGKNMETQEVSKLIEYFGQQFGTNYYKVRHIYT